MTPEQLREEFLRAVLSIPTDAFDVSKNSTVKISIETATANIVVTFADPIKISY